MKEDVVIKSLEDSLKGFISTSFDVENIFEHSCNHFRTGPTRPILIGRTIKIQCAVDAQNPDPSGCKPLDVKVQCSACGADIFQENYYSNKTCGECGNIAGAWMHKPADWKKLYINDLPYRWYEEGKYEFEYWSTCNSEWLTYEHIYERVISVIESSTHDSTKWRYRLKPTKKTPEELAEEYAEKTIEVYGEILLPEEAIRDISRKAFMAGRKSMESEK